MSKKLLIVESPAKAKTIEKILGKDFTVKSSFGHIRDLEKGNSAIDVKHNFHPHYVVSPEKLKVVKELKEQAKKVDEVWLATDEDREGEAISWHLCEVLGLDIQTTKRIVFTEITKPAILKAVENPRKVDINLVNAQQARRILDRLVGFELSELLWRKVKGKLSAGRVQSVAVKLIVEREREIQHFNSQSFFKIEALFNVLNHQGKLAQVKAEIPKEIKDHASAESFVKGCVGANYTIKNIDVKPSYRKPAPPFTTSTLQQEASRKLGFNVNRTMLNAQKLYEMGHITYMRTDSPNLSEVAISSIASEIQSQFGKEYLYTRRFKSKNSSAQEAHEAIRPTYIDKKWATEDRDQQRLYELIWKRTIASQMTDAVLERTIVQIDISSQPKDTLVAEGEVLKFDGFLKVYMESHDEDEDEDIKGVLPPMKVGQKLDLDVLTATERFTKPPARYSEASLVKKLEELGIGRPSTYAPTISKIMEDNRGYVIRDNREGVERPFRIVTLKSDKINLDTKKENTGAVKNRLFPTDMGMLVTDFLNQYFDAVMDYKFTAGIEERFDKIAEGKNDWVNMLSEFYFPFHDVVDKTLKEADRATGERILGKDPATNHTVLVRLSKYGSPLVQIGTKEEIGEETPRYANLKADQSMESLDLASALELFQLPKVLGKMQDGSEISVNNGRFGPYVKYGDQFVSLPKGEDPLEVNLARAVELIQHKMEENAPFMMYEGLPVTKGKGRFGPFIKWNDLYINIPARFKIETITPAQGEELIQQKLTKEANRYIHNWATEKISVENGRWGPFVKFGKYMLKILPNADGKKMSEEEVKNLQLDQVKAMIEIQMPGAFDKKTTTKKTAAKKPAAKKTTKK